MAAMELRPRRPPQAATLAGQARRGGPLVWTVGCALTVSLAVFGSGVDRATAQQSSAQPTRPGVEIAPDVAERIKVHIPSVILAEPARETAMDIYITMRDQIPNNSLLRIRGLPASATLSEGHAIAPGAWAVPIAALQRVRLTVPADGAGKSEVTVLLVTVDGHVLAEAKSALVVGATARLIAPDLPSAPAADRATATAPIAPPVVAMTPPVVSNEPVARPEPRPQVSTPVATPPPESAATKGAPSEAMPNTGEKASSAEPAPSPPATAVVIPPPPTAAPAKVAAVVPEPPTVVVVPLVAAPVPPPTIGIPSPPPVAAVPPAAPSPAPSAPKTSVAAIPPSAITPAPAVKPPPLSAEARGRAMTFVTRGTSMLDEGNIAGARQFFERAAEVGLAEGAMALGTTYDPHELARLKVHGLRPDVATARRWYEKARDLGSPQAVDHLARLGF